MASVPNLDENNDHRYQPSASSLDENDQSSTETTRSSPLSGDSFAYCRTDSAVSAFSGPTGENSYSDTVSALSVKSPTCVTLSRLGMKQHNNIADDPGTVDLEFELMKERYAKLLLGEDMSGSGNGVSTAVAISNSITNLYASVFGQHLRLEPLHADKKLMWKREMNCLLSICGYIVESITTSQILQDGTTVEVTTGRPRSDIYINLPALRKLDTMLLEILDCFEATEFWYAEQGSVSGRSRLSGSFRRIIQPQPQSQREDKWWLPVVCIPSGGLSEKCIQHLRHNLNCANQIHKAAMAINSSILSDIEIPDSYMASLPKSGKAIVGDSLYRYMYSAEKFSPEYLLDNLNISSEHEALVLADKVEASMYTWRQKACMTGTKSSWDTVKDLISEINRTDKYHVLAERAEILLVSLKQRYPELPQTTLDTSKIQCNKDVGKAILESYSRVLESSAFNIAAWIEDVIFVDKTMKNQGQ